LQRERLAQLAPAQGKLELDVQMTTLHNTEDIFAKETSAFVTRVFSYRTRTAAVRARRDVLRVAAETGWRVNRVPWPVGLGYVGWKRLTPGDAKLNVIQYGHRGRYFLSIHIQPAR
jgi:hypothetical protein